MAVTEGSAGPSRALLCFHGTGSSGHIFRVQLSRMRLALGKDTELIFVDGPHPSTAGPGVLPLFADEGPFYSWFGAQAPTIEGALPKIHESVRKAVQQWEETKQNPEARIVGFLSFSEGALVSALLLWQQQLGLVPWLPEMQLAVLICCYFADEATSYLRADATLHGRQDTFIDIPTVHLHGRRDFCLARARKLVTNHCRPENVHVVEFDGGHHCPTKKDVYEKVAEHIHTLVKVN
ncbi:serine hydrolase FSH [Trichoderma velutinum]